MSCFWDALFNSLTDNDYKFLYFKIYNIQNNIDKISSQNLKIILRDIRKTNTTDLVLLLRKYNTKCINVLWNNSPISPKENEDNFTHIKDFLKNNDNTGNINSIINSGYLCSICDPFLILICELFEFQIEHRFLNETMTYKNIKNIRRSLQFKSNTGHFS